MSGQEIRQPKRKFFTMLPNLYDDADLDPYEFRLLTHYVRVGDCFESTRTTAEKCNMGHMTVVRKRKSLAEKGFIRLTRTPDFTRVEVVDKWDENMGLYQRDTPDEDVYQSDTGVDQTDTPLDQSDTGAVSERDIKKNPLKKTPQEKPSKNNNKPAAARMLAARAVPDKAIQELIADHPPWKIIDLCQAYDFQKSKGRANGPGWLVQAIREDYDWPAGFVPERLKCPECGRHRERHDSSCPEKFKNLEYASQEEE